MAGDEVRELAAQVGPEEVERDRVTAVRRGLLPMAPALPRLVAGDVDEPAVVVLVPTVGVRVEEVLPEPSLQPQGGQPALLTGLAQRRGGGVLPGAIVPAGIWMPASGASGWVKRSSRVPEVT